MSGDPWSDEHAERVEALTEVDERRAWRMARMAIIVTLVAAGGGTAYALWPEAEPCLAVRRTIIDAVPTGEPVSIDEALDHHLANTEGLSSDDPADYERVDARNGLVQFFHGATAIYLQRSGETWYVSGNQIADR